jgi:DNA-binding transcriptional LysR family regulator
MSATVGPLIVQRTVSYCYLNVKHRLMKNATLRQLRVFASVARHLSFIRAAEEMNLTAPAVSMQIKELELEVGLPLFDRSSRKVSLTMVGEYMLAHTRRVLSAMRDAEDLVARFRGLQTGVLDVGMVSTAKYFLPRLLAQFRDEHPGIEIRLQVSNNREQVVMLMQQGDIELAIMGRPPKGWPTRAEPFAMHPHVLVTSIDHPFTRMEEVPASALSGEGFIVREPRSGTRAALDEYMRGASDGAARGDADVEQRGHQAGGDGRHGHVAAVAAHHGTGTRSPPDRDARMPRACRSCGAGTWSTTWPRRCRRPRRRSATSFSNAARHFWRSKQQLNGQAVDEACERDCFKDGVDRAA